MTLAIVDIETAPLPREEQDAYMPEFVSRLKQPETDMPPAKIGNLKNPDKIWAKKRAHEDAWLVENSRRIGAIRDEREEFQEKFYASAQLDATRCRVCAVGLKLPGGDPLIMLAGETVSEANLLAAFWRIIAERDRVAGHIIGYDLGILEQRTMILGKPGHFDLTRAKHNRDFYADRFVDTAKIWKPRGSSVQTPAGLDVIGQALGMGRKPGDGKDFWTWDEDKQREYLEHDLRVCEEILKRSGEI